MYEYIQGTVAKADDTAVIVDVHGIGYRIHTLNTTLQHAIESLSRSEKLSFFIELIIREDSHTLYGFISEYERALFRILIGMSGVGAKLALQIMNRGSLQEVLQALSERNTSWLSSISGIGKKTAERIGLELSDKAQQMLLLCVPTYRSESMIPLSSDSTTTTTSSLPIIENISIQAIEALVSLGLSEIESKKCIKEAFQHANEVLHEQNLTLPRILQLALHLRKKGS